MNKNVKFLMKIKYRVINLKIFISKLIKISCGNSIRKMSDKTHTSKVKLFYSDNNSQDHKKNAQKLYVNSTLVNKRKPVSQTQKPEASDEAQFEKPYHPVSSGIDNLAKVFYEYNSAETGADGQPLFKDSRRLNGHLGHDLYLAHNANIVDYANEPAKDPWWYLKCILEDWNLSPRHNLMNCMILGIIFLFLVVSVVVFFVYRKKMQKQINEDRFWSEYDREYEIYFADDVI